MEQIDLKNKIFELESDGKKYRYTFKNLKSIQAETANHIMAWFNDATNRMREVSFKELHRSDIFEVKDAVVAHLVREVTSDGKLIPYEPDEARTTIKNFMSNLNEDEFGKVKDEIIDNFFLMQNKSHLATMILRREPKKSLSKENIDLLLAVATAMNSQKSQEEKN